MTRRLFLFVWSIFLFGARLAVPDDLRCRVCGRVIAEGAKYYRAGDSGEVFCESCIISAPKCSFCKLPMARDLMDPATGACPKCLAKLPRCKACGKAIVATIFKFPYAEGVFCAECKNNRPACHVCGVPVGNSYWRYPDGRTVCDECTRRAVVETSAIEAVMKDVHKTAERQLGLKITVPYSLHVERLAGNSSYDPRKSEDGIAATHLYGKELGMYRRTNDKSEIVLLFGLPPEMIYETAAHEYAHAWQAENCSTDLEPELREGFAQWVAAEVLRLKGYRIALERLEARKDKPYGTGYQRLKNLHRQIIIQLLRERF